MLDRIDLSRVFHQSSKNHFKGHPVILKDSTKWPKEWKTQYYKVYPRLTKIVLPDTELPNVDFSELIRNRRSSRKYDKQPISLGELSLLLKYSCGITQIAEDGIAKRAQASGGAMYPLEVYPIVFVPTDGLSAGAYHYDVKHHQLDVLLKRSFSPQDIAGLFAYDWVQDVSMVFVITAVFQRNQMKYGERGYRYMLLEAGHIGQNIHLNTEALHLKSCGLGGTYDQAIETLLDIDGVTESVVYAVAIGK